MGIARPKIRVPFVSRPRENLESGSPIFRFYGHVEYTSVEFPLRAPHRLRRAHLGALGMDRSLTEGVTITSFDDLVARRERSRDYSDQA